MTCLFCSLGNKITSNIGDVPTNRDQVTHSPAGPSWPEPQKRTGPDSRRLSDRRISQTNLIKRYTVLMLDDLCPL